MQRLFCIFGVDSPHDEPIFYIALALFYNELTLYSLLFIRWMVFNTRNLASQEKDPHIVKKYAPCPEAKISISVLATLICLPLLLLSCGIGKGPTRTGTETEEILWKLTNPKYSFDAFLNPDSLDYQLEDPLTLHLRVTNDAYIIIFNWDENGTLKVLLPNAYQENNAIKVGTTYTFSETDADFDLRLSEGIGTKRFKVIALRSADDSRAIIDFFPVATNAFRLVSGTQRVEVEEKIVTYLRRIGTENWAENNQTVEVHARPSAMEPALSVQPVTPKMFFQPLRVGDDVVINAGALGRYQFSADTEPPDVPSHIIRRELVDLLNELQGTFGQPMLITSGYRSRQHQIYLWAKWLSEYPEHVNALNRQEHSTWEAWVNASQSLPGCPRLRSKHQTGEAVNFYWKTLNLDSEAQRERLIAEIREAGGTRDYTPEERQRFGIPDADDYLLRVTAHPANESEKAEHSSGGGYLRVVYRPSTAPTMPSSERIGTLLPPPEPEKGLWALTNPESDLAVSLKTDSPHYQIDDFLTLEARTTDDAYIIIFSRDQTGRLVILIPNTYQPDNFVRAGTSYFIPEADTDFDLRVSGPPGVEQFKVIALRYNRNNRDIIDLFRTGQDSTSQQFWYWEHSEAQIVEKRIVNYLRQINPEDWAEDTDTAEVREAEPPDTPGPPVVIPSDYSVGDVIYIQDGSNMYFGEITAEVTEGSETVAVNIFNEELQNKLGETVPTELVIGRRAEPPRGWGIHEIMLSFYRDGEWTFTTDAVVFEEYYLLPARIDGDPVRGSRKVSLGEVRIPIPISYPSSD